MPEEKSSHCETKNLCRFAAMFFPLKKYFLLSLFLLPSLAFSQSKKETKVLIGEKGLYPLYNYSTKEYRALPQNWAIMQDKRGVMYFGNNQGILEYDGVSWRMMKVFNETNIRSFAMDESGKIFSGAAGDFGFLAPDSSGSIHYRSLLKYVSKDDRDFSDIWCTQATKNGIFFQSDDKIFRWNGTEIKVWHASKTFHRIFKINNRIFVREREVGLLEIKGDNIELVKGGDAFADETIYAMIPFPSANSEDILLCTKKKGLFLLKSTPRSSEFKLEQFPTQIDPFLFENLSYHLLKTPVGYSIATVTKGAVLIDAEGNLVNFLNKDIGLQDETIYSQFIDNSGNLWLALSNGISRVSIKSPVTYFSDKNGPGGTVQYITRHNNTLYTTTVQGVYFLNPGNVTNGNILSSASFDKIPSINEECWDILSFKNGNYSTLLVASSGNIYTIDDNKKVSSLFPYGPWILYRSKYDSSRIFLGLNNGFASIYWNGTKWMDEGSILEIKESVRSVEEDKEGNVWLGHDNGVIKIKFRNNSPGARKNSETQSYSYTKYNSSAGLPDGTVELQSIDGNVLFFTVKGIYKLEGEKFSPETKFGSVFADGTHQVYRVSPDKQSGKIWMETYYTEKNKYEFGFLSKEKNGTYSWNATPFMPYTEEIIHSIYHDGNGITWFGGAAGLFRYDANEDKNETKTFASIIRKITIGKDSTIFNGTSFDSTHISALKQNSLLVPRLPFSSNSMNIEFSALDFINENAERFQYYLEGFDNDWSNWKRETKAVYTNLPEGKYIFHVKAKNIFNQESTEAAYEFSIAPPWYRTWWAYILYVLASIGFVWGIVTYTSRGLKAIIRERTAEIVKQKEEIEYKNRNITDSINYAKRIQDAILPHYELMRSKFPESFILYRPKDIVAGDFYWFAEKEGKFIVAACDCTGHGVPGAFMSLIGYSLLNEVLLEKHFASPANALDAMKRGIIKSLGQTGQEGEQKDGMDMSLVSLEVSLEENKMKQKLVYAGANNPLYLVRKGELIELNADKMPIGIYLGQDRPFVDKEITLEAGDTFYMFSDGYADQFGGKDGKKFTKKRFKDTLRSLEHTPMSRQKVLLENTMDEWLGENQQIDDVLVVGIRI
ncbi:MAG: SpoIIE family protein phosphatase [Bacteroidetes bacterium]|nr:SpoIIE family protein phosphatase [Bacteroidota bacterium]